MGSATCSSRCGTARRALRRMTCPNVSGPDSRHRQVCLARRVPVIWSRSPGGPRPRPALAYSAVSVPSLLAESPEGEAGPAASLDLSSRRPGRAHPPPRRTAVCPGAVPRTAGPAGGGRPIRARHESAGAGRRRGTATRRAAQPRQQGPEIGSRLDRPGVPGLRPTSGALPALPEAAQPRCVRRGGAAVAFGAAAAIMFPHGRTGCHWSSPRRPYCSAMLAVQTKDLRRNAATGGSHTALCVNTSASALSCLGDATRDSRLEFERFARLYS